MLSTLLSLLCTPHAPPTTLPQGASVRRVVQAMGTPLTIHLTARTRPQALEASEAVIMAIGRIEGQLSTWRGDTELSGMMKAPANEWVALSPELGAALERAFYWCAQSNGTFDPTVAPLVRCWDLRGEGRLPEQEQLATALAASGPRHFNLDLPHRIARRNDSAGIEEGGFGKGAALDAALLALNGFSIQAGTLDLGGQVSFLPSGEPGTLALVHPDDRQQKVALLQRTHGSCATSGNSERGMQVQGQRIGHLLDPRTGKPAPDFGSVTVWCPRGIDADCLSTALYVLGPGPGLAFAEKQPDVEAIFLVRKGASLVLHASSGLRGKLTSLDEELPIQWSAPGAVQSPPR